MYSEPGKGSRFSIYLPSAGNSHEATPDTESQLPLGQGELILVVDDEENIRNVASATLEAFGYKAVTAIDGTDALAVFSQRRGEIAAVLTDMAMPYIDGPALIRALRKMDPKIKIVAMSGLFSEGQAEELSALNVRSMISKPYSAETLLTALKAVLNE